MLVANVIGYDFSFNYKGVDGEGVITIPFDHKPYKVPNDIPQFKELKQVVIVDAPVNDVNNESVEQHTQAAVSKPNYAQDYQNFPKTKQEKEQEKVEPVKPLAGKKIKKTRKKQILSKKE